MKALAEYKAEELLKDIIPIADHKLTNTVNEAIKTASKLKYPVVLKIISTKALHKTEIGGVLVADSSDELKQMYAKLQKIATKKKIKIEGIMIQQFVKGTELVIGIKKDPTFDHVIMLGIGGVFVEVLKDVSFRACPITKEDAKSMIEELKSKKMLFGFRGSKPAKLKILIDSLVKLSKLPRKYPNITELDINPFILNDKEGYVADARIVFD